MSTYHRSKYWIYCKHAALMILDIDVRFCRPDFKLYRSSNLLVRGQRWDNPCASVWSSATNWFHIRMTVIRYQPVSTGFHKMIIHPLGRQRFFLYRTPSLAGKHIFSYSWHNTIFWRNSELTKHFPNEKFTTQFIFMRCFNLFLCGESSFFPRAEMLLISYINLFFLSCDFWQPLDLPHLVLIF